MNRYLAIILYLAIGGVILGADLWSKDWVFRYLQVNIHKGDDGLPRWDQTHPKVLWPGKLDLEAAVNLGAFNGWFGNLPGLLRAVSIIAVVVTFLIVAVPARAGPMLVIALGLLAGGAVGNLYDRIVFGGVRDFIKFYHGDWVWPNFNVADSAICTGVGLLLLREILMMRKKPEEESAEPAKTAETTPAEEPAAG